MSKLNIEAIKGLAAGIAIAIAAAVVVGTVGYFLSVDSETLKKLGLKHEKSTETKQNKSENKSNQQEVSLDSGNYYKATIEITENNKFETGGQVYSNGAIYSTYTSDEILYYDAYTEKCYIIARILTFTGIGTIIVTHSSGVFNETRNYDSEGSLYEHFGDMIKFNDEDPKGDYSELPVRIDVKNGKIFTIVPTKTEKWVVTTIGREVILGEPYIFTPSELTHQDVSLIPSEETINISKNYRYTETFVDEATGRILKPYGTFTCNLKKITDAEAMLKMAEISARLHEIEKKFSEDMGLTNENENTGQVLPKDYPSDVVPIVKDAKITISETIKGDQTGENSYNVTLKSDMQNDKVIEYYKQATKDASNRSYYTSGGFYSIIGEKGKYEFSIFITPNTMGGPEKTLVQIEISPKQ